MKQKLKIQRSMTRICLLILSVITVILYLRVINIFYTDIYLDTIFKLINSVHNDVIHKTANILLVYPPIILFYLIIPIHIFSVVYKKFRKDILGY